MEYIVIPEDWEKPEWRVDGKGPHDWHRYTTESVRVLWDTFNDKQKQALASCFYETTLNEEWD